MDRTRFRLAVTLIVGLALAWYAWLIAPARQWVDGNAYWLLFDDPMISMRYARNLAQGHGLVWNPGGARVEGFSNPLYTLLMALAHIAAPSPASAPLLVILIGAAILVGNGLTAMLLSRRAGADDPAALAVLGVVLFQPPLAFWTLRGFEVGLVSLLVLAALFSVFDEGKWRWLGPLLAALILARADGMVLAGAILLVAAVQWGPIASWRRLAASACWPIAALALSTGARWLYYGELLPNTYYLKMTGGPPQQRWSRGLEVLERGLMRHHPAILAFFASALAKTGLGNHAGRVLASALFVWAVGAAYSVPSGGDAWDSLHIPNRFMSTVMSLPLMGAALGAAWFLRRAGNVASAFVSAGVLAWIAGMHVDFLPATGRRMAFMDSGATLYMRWIVDGAVAGGALLALMLLPPIRRHSFGVGMVLLAFALALSTGANVLAKRVAGRTAYIEDEVQQVTLARVLALHSLPRARIAVSWAGTMPYHLERTYSDTLGKCDPHIARLPHAAGIPYHPGHSKWDLKHTVETEHPDAIIRPFEVRPEEEDFLRESGYIFRGESAWVLGDSTSLSEEFKALDTYDIDSIRELLKTAPTFPRTAETSIRP